MSDLLGSEVRICHKMGTVRENPAEDDSYVVELGGIHQEIIVSEQFVLEQRGDA